MWGDPRSHNASPVIDHPEAVEDEAVGGQDPDPRFSSEIRLKCAVWSQVEALCADVSEGGTVVVPLQGATGYVTVKLELPDGECVELRAHLSGTMLDAEGAPTALVLEPRPTYQMRADLHAAAGRVVPPHADHARIEALAGEAVAWTPRTSGISPRGAGAAAPADPIAAPTHASPAEDPISDHPTVPPPRKKT